MVQYGGYSNTYTNLNISHISEHYGGYGGAGPVHPVEEGGQEGSGIGGSSGRKRPLQDPGTQPLDPKHLKNLVKEEPRLSPHAGILADEEYSFDGLASPGGTNSDGSLQCIRFSPFQQSSWCTLTDINLKELELPMYKVDADKGFNFSNADDAFVCQKKNHFQITCHIQMYGEPAFVQTPNGLQKVDGFSVHFYGVKMESPSQTIRIEQSQSDRTKKPFHPVPVEVSSSMVTKMTVGRLHFSETTSNNMRKKGKPNPDQRYFHLVVALQAQCGDQRFPVVTHASEKIIVRASNPGQFENDMEVCWQKGGLGDTIFHIGQVGVNTDRPDEALVVHGNIKLTGHMIQPSDRRAKSIINELDSRKQLENLSRLRVVEYNYSPEVAEHLGLSRSQVRNTDVGIIAQELQEVLPEAVESAGDVRLSNGHLISNFLLVNKDRLFMENIGAVKELHRVTLGLESRVERLENKHNHKKRYPSASSASSFSSLRSHGGKYHSRERSSSQHSHCRFISTAVILILALCLVAMATVYIIEYRRRESLVDVRSLLALFPVEKGRELGGPSRIIGSSDEISFHLQASMSPSNPWTHRNLVASPSLSTQSASVSFHPYHPRPTPLGRPPPCSISPTASNGILASSPCQVLYVDPTEESEGLLELQNELGAKEGNRAPPLPILQLRDGRHMELFSEMIWERGTNGEPIGTKQNRPRRHTPINESVSPALKEFSEPRVEGIHVYGEDWNATVTGEYCTDGACLKNGIDGLNFTYAIPLSKFMPDEFIHLQFRVEPGAGQLEECMSPVPFLACPWTEDSKRKRKTGSGGNFEVGAMTAGMEGGSRVDFRVYLGSWQVAASRFRLPLLRSFTPNDGGLCEAEAGGFVEYNFLFYRVCDA
ncbi:unnamed protein product [Darwinula stevensoni]|uniref:Myelin regulatory factor-like protein n=1 Tax=Darwinula stevensoni TaxID=69355 RepID=A0A7R8XDC1_9CRUS|nr:unnamed protein product [Darwinula stevensoni]CAG0893085.1 unnamed protein product [Darwinula stevensoni]